MKDFADSLIKFITSLYLSLVMASLGWAVLLTPIPLAEQLGFTHIRNNRFVLFDTPVRTILGLVTVVFTISTFYLLIRDLWRWFQTRKAKAETKATILARLHTLSNDERLLFAYCLIKRQQTVSLEITDGPAVALVTKRLLLSLDPDERPRWILVSDFAHFVLWDLGPEVHEYLQGLSSARKTKPTVVAQFTLRQLPEKLHYFAFIRDEEQQLWKSEPEVIARVNVDQFYGIELEEFPALIAETAMWLTDHQVNMAFSKAFGRHYARIPLKKSAAIHNKNALRTDWKTVLPPNECSYILGNPPFVGQTYQSEEQKKDQAFVLADLSAKGVLDFVCNWYVLAAQYIQGSGIRCAFVSTNSITQGEQVGILWSYLFSRYQVKIHFGFRTFPWSNEAAGKAAVHVVIVGFGYQSVAKKRIFESAPYSCQETPMSISPYLVIGSETVIGNRTTPLNDVPKMSWGNKPTDGGHFIMSPDERRELLDREPQAAPLVRRYMGGGDFINDIVRYCLWLVDADPALIRKCPTVLSRIEKVREFRLQSEAKSTQAYASKPTLFRQIAQPNSAYLAIPEVSSENRDYIPMAFLDKDVICSNTLQFVPAATAYHFGILTSCMHMAWVRTVCGRLKSDYRYSNSLVYNNYPWPEPSDNQREAIETAAQNVLDARKPHLAGGASLADLYSSAMPPALITAHQALDRAVEKAYRPKPFINDRERVEFLFALYEKISSPLAPTAGAKARGRKMA